MIYKLKDKFVQFRDKYFFKWTRYNLDISVYFSKLFVAQSIWKMNCDIFTALVY